MTTKADKPTVRIIKASAVPARARNATPKLFKLLASEWAEIQRCMLEDRIGVGQYCELTIPPAFLDEADLKTPKQVRRPIKRYIDENPKFKRKYEVKARRTNEGTIVVLIGQPLPAA